MANKLGSYVAALIIGLISYAGCVPTQQMIDYDQAYENLLDKAAGTLSVAEQERIDEQSAEKKAQRDFAGLSFGIGAVVDPNVQILGDGFVADQAPPAGETQVRFKEKSQTGILFLASFGF